MAQSFYPTAENLIDDALEILRAVDPTEALTPQSTQRTKGLRALNYLVNSWLAIGFNVWCVKSTSVTLVAGTSSYTFGPSGAIATARPMAVLRAWLHNTAQDTDPIHLTQLSREDYNKLTNKESESTPYAFYYDPQYDLPASNSGANAKGKLYIYPTADTVNASTYTMTVLYSRPIQDFSATSDSLDFPQEWNNALKWNLADQLAPAYGVPVMYWDRIAAKAESELKRVSGWDHEEGSMYIQPENREGK